MQRSDVIASMVLPLSRAYFRCEHAVTEEVVVSVCVAWQGGLIFFNQKKIKSPTSIQNIADFTFSGSNKAKICL